MTVPSSATASRPCPWGRVHVDSQSVRADATVKNVSRGFYGGKKANGRKGHLIVDSLGLLLGVLVAPASMPDRDAARTMLAGIRDHVPRLGRMGTGGGSRTESAGAHGWCPSRCPRPRSTVRRATRHRSRRRRDGGPHGGCLGRRLLPGRPPHPFWVLLLPGPGRFAGAGLGHRRAGTADRFPQGPQGR
ncbi:transposase [Streptomyces sp. NPDC049590]|uniref:transposase n=1 Tax=Streptomyces sp. NPDC049590 TaxID=3154834 RepID=UPI0034195518